MRTIIVGGGRVGLRTAELLSDRGHDSLIVERRSERCERLSDAYVSTVIEGDGTDPSVLRQAGLDRADAVIALTNETGLNFTVCLLADRLTDVRTVMRLVEADGDDYAPFVDAVIDPERAGARMAANAAESEVRALEDAAGGVEILEVTVAEGAPVAGRSLATVSLPRGSLVVSDSGAGTIAGPKTALDAGQTYVVATEPDVESEVVNLFRG